MLRSLKEHIYGGNHFRPAPILINSQDHLSVFTVWGQLGEEIQEQLRDLTPNEDESLIHHAHRIHQHLYQAYQGKLGLEGLTMRKDRARLVQWCGCGQPGLYLLSHQKSVLLHQSLDLNFDSSARPFEIPLPGALLGVEEATPPLSTGTFQLQPGQKIALISRSWLPSLALESIFEADRCIQALASEAEDMPFWWGLFEPDL